MSPRRRPTIAETQNAITILESALADLGLFLDSGNTDDCDIPSQVRDESAPFLGGYVEQPLQRVLTLLKRSGC